THLRHVAHALAARRARRTRAARTHAYPAPARRHRRWLEHRRRLGQGLLATRGRRPADFRRLPPNRPPQPIRPRTLAHALRHTVTGRRGLGIAGTRLARPPV